MARAILLDLPAERLVPLFLLFCVFLLLKDRGCSKGIGGLVPLVKNGAADHSQRRKDCKKQFRVDRVQHCCRRSGDVGLPSVAFVHRRYVVGCALLLNEGHGIEVGSRRVALLHIGYRHLCRETRLQAAL